MPTLRECVQDALRNLGVNQAQGFRITTTNGEVIEVNSNRHPALDREIDPSHISNVSRVSSAKAGL